MAIPTLMQVAGEDYIVNADASERFFGNLKLADKTLHRYPGRYHEIYNETPELRSTVLDDLQMWLVRQINGLHT